MSERIHDDEPDTSEAVVRALLRHQRPALADHGIDYLRTSGTDNAMWRLRPGDGPDLVVRLPRRPAAAAGVDQEVAVLRAIRDSPVAALVATPVVRDVGRPEEVFPHPWTILEWIDGVDAWTGRDQLTGPGGDLDRVAVQLAEVVRAIGQLADLDVRARRPGQRGGPLAPLLDRLDHWLTEPEWNAGGLIDVAAVDRLAAQARELVEHGVVHGDLIPGNLLLDRGQLAAVLDWGGAGFGDRAQDLAPAWSVLDRAGRARFRQALEVDDPTWIRGRIFELEHAVGGVLYYRPRNHPLGEVMAATLDRILTDR